MRILTPHLALTYPNHCPTSCRTNSHFVCPKPELIEKYLKDKAGFEGHIREQDKACIPCYRSHITFLHEENLIALIVI